MTRTAANQTSLETDLQSGPNAPPNVPPNVPSALAPNLAEAQAFAELRDTVARLASELDGTRRELAVAVNSTQETAGHYRRLLDAIPAGVVVIGADGRVQDGNLAACGLLGIGGGGSPGTPLQPEQGSPLVGMPWRAIVENAFSPRADDGHDISLKSGRRVNISTCSLSGEPGQLVVLSDVTETRALQAESARLERLSTLGRAMSNLAHQIRTPLASALLQASALSEPRAREKVLPRLRDLERLVEDMLTFAQRGHFDVERLELADLLAEAASYGAESGVAVSVEVPPPPNSRSESGPDPISHNLTPGNHPSADSPPAMDIEGNRKSLVSVFRNLIENAGQAGAGRVRLEVVPGPDARLTVLCSDDGPGLGSVSNEQLFEPFFTTRPAGTGLGLAVVKVVVEAHGGAVSLLDSARVVSSDGLLNGAAFVISLPAAQPAEMRSPDPTSLSPGLVDPPPSRVVATGDVTDERENHS